MEYRVEIAAPGSTEWVATGRADWNHEQATGFVHLNLSDECPDGYRIRILRRRGPRSEWRGHRTYVIAAGGVVRRTDGAGVGPSATEGAIVAAGREAPAPGAAAVPHYPVRCEGPERYDSSEAEVIFRNARARWAREGRAVEIAAAIRLLTCEGFTIAIGSTVIEGAAARVESAS